MLVLFGHMAYNLKMSLIIYALLFAIAAVLAMLGKGGGEFYLPILVASGVPFHQAGTISLFMLTVSGSVMAAVYHRKSLIDWTLGTMLILTAGLGSFFGGLISVKIPSFYLKLTFSAMLLVSAYFVARPPTQQPRVPKVCEIKRNCCGESYSISCLVFPVVAFIGFLAGMVGISGGGVIIPLVVILSRMPLRVALATNSLIVLFSSFSGFIGHGLSQSVPWGKAVPAAASVAVGALIGAHFSTRVHISRLKKLFVFILVFAALWMLFNALRKV